MEAIQDLKSQFVQLLQKESVLCLFEFVFPLQSGARVSGVGKLSRPRDGESKMNYLSLLFICDAKEETAKAETAHAIRELRRIPEYVRRVRHAVLTTPAYNAGGEMYCQQVDLVLDSHSGIGKDFVLDRVFPAVQLLSHFEPQQWVWLESSTPAEHAAQQRRRLLPRLKKLIGRTKE